MNAEPIIVKRKQSVYLDENLVECIAAELKELRALGLIDISVQDIIRKRIRESYAIVRPTDEK